MRLPTACYFALFMAVFDGLRTSRIWPEEEGATAWSAVAVLSAMEAVALGALEMWFDMLGREPLTITRSAALNLYIGLFVLNFVVFVRRRRWERFRVSFRAFPIRRQRLLKWSGRIAVSVVFFGCVYTLHRFLGWTPPR